MKVTFEVWPNMPWGRLEIAGPAWNSWGDKPLDWCVRRLAEIGYDGMDVIYASIQAIPGAEYGRSVDAVRKAAEDTGLELGYIGGHTTFVSPRWFDREAGIAKFKRAIDSAVDFGFRSVVTLLGDGFFDPPLNILMRRKDAWKQAVDAVREVAEYAGAREIDVSIELLQGTIVNRVELMLRLFEEVGMENVKATVDAGTFYTTVKPFVPVPEALRVLGDRVNVVHVKDEVGFPTIMQSNHIWFGGGLVNFKELYEGLRAIDFQGYASVEWEGWQVGGVFGVGEPAGLGQANMDIAAEEALAFLREFGFHPRRESQGGR